MSAFQPRDGLPSPQCAVSGFPSFEVVKNRNSMQMQLFLLSIDFQRDFAGTAFLRSRWSLANVIFAVLELWLCRPYTWL